MIGAFMGGQGAKARSIAYCDDGTTPGLKASNSGSNQAPDVVYSIEGNTVDRSCAKNGKGWSENQSPTLNTIDWHAVCYPNIARTLTARFDSSPCIDRGGEVVCYSPKGNHCGVYEEAETAATLITRYNYGSGGDAALKVYDCRGNVDGKTVPTLTGDHENPIVFCKQEKPKRRWIVLRLTPLECNRLQGFPDGWGDVSDIKELSDEEHAFWLSVRNTHAAINGKKQANYTKDQMIRWLNKLHTDSAEYKMWGNGIALPCASDVMRRIDKELRKGEWN